MTLNEVMKDTADAIREKTGKSELIAPVNFAEEIREISGGGNDSRIIYLKYDKTNSDFISYALYSFLVRGAMEGEDGLDPCVVTTLLSNTPTWKETKALAINLDDVISMKKGDQVMTLTIEEMLISSGIDISTAIQITKEQFYDLNA